MSNTGWQYRRYDSLDSSVNDNMLNQLFRMNANQLCDIQDDDIVKRVGL